MLPRPITCIILQRFCLTRQYLQISHLGGVPKYIFEQKHEIQPHYSSHRTLEYYPGNFESFVKEVNLADAEAEALLLGQDYLTSHPFTHDLVRGWGRTP